MKYTLSRRTLLRGAGAALGLPWMEAMASTGPSAAPPVRMAFLYMPNGVNVPAWTPAGSGASFKLSPTLASLEPVKDQVTVVSGLWNAAAKGGDGHYVKEAAILTCQTIKKTQGADLGNGTSVDQMAAKQVANQTPLPSLELGVAPVAIGVDAVVGYTRVYGSHIAWSDSTTPLAREINPRAVFERLFRASTAPAPNAAKADKLLLDRVLGDAKRLRNEVGAADQVRLDEYLSLMRQLEARVERASAAHAANMESARRDGP